MKVLVAVDIAHPHEDLVEHVGWLIPMQDAEVTLLYVREVYPSYEPVAYSVGDFPDDWANEIENKARQTLKELESKLTGVTDVRSEIVSGPPSFMIAEVARDISADVTVVTPGTHSTIEKFLLGSVSSKVVGAAPGLTLVLKDHKGHDKLEHIVIGVDGSDHSISALEKATQLLQVKERSIKLSVLNVGSIPDVLTALNPYGIADAIEKNMKTAGEEVLARALESLSRHGVSNVDTKFLRGQPSQEIIKYAEDNNAQLIVTGARSHSAVEHALMGSVASRVVAHSKCSVAVITN